LKQIVNTWLKIKSDSEC